MIKDVITNDFDFDLTEKETNDFDIMWHSTGMKTNEIKKLKSHQKYNHFPGTYQLAKKTSLGRNLMKMNRLFPDDYKFFPKTWVLPNDFPDFVKYSKHHEGQTYIVKPDILSQGKGIFLTKTKDDINPQTNNVIQEYIDNPFLVDNLKFDIRLYVFVTSVDPLRIYLFDDGLVRFATEEYQKPTEENINNTFIHLTNYAINKNHKNFVFSEKGNNSGHKRTLKSFLKMLNEQGIETNIIMEEIKDIIIKTFLAVQPQLAHEYKSCLSEDIDGSMCFEILGFDVMLDENLDPYLIEVNHAPSFATDSELDMKIKKQLLKDSFRMLDMSVKRKVKYKKESNIISQNRMLTGRKETNNQDEKDRIRKFNNIARHKFELENKGKYELLYPLIDDNGKIVGNHFAYKNDFTTDSDTKPSSENSIRDNKQEIESGVTQSSMHNVSEEKELTEKEKTNIKYQQFIDDAFEVWDDLCNGFRYKSKYSVVDINNSGRKSKVDMLNSRNPNKAKEFQKTMKFGSKAGFGSSSNRIEVSSNRLAKNMETPKPSNISDSLKSKRSVYSNTQTPSKILMNSVLSKYVSKSIVITSETEARRVPQANKGRKGVKMDNQCLPVITYQRAVKEGLPQSNKNSMPKLPKVL